MKRIAPTEHQEQVALFQWRHIMSKRDLRLDMLIAIPNAGGYIGGYKSNLLRVMSMKAEGVAKGFPDIALLCPNKKHAGLFIELKRIGGKVSPDQRCWIEKLRLCGYHATVCYGASEAITEIKAYLGLK